MPEKLPAEFLFDPGFGRDPYVTYAKLRDQGPVHPIDLPPGTDAFLVIGYEYGRPALNDPRLSKDMRHAPSVFRDLVTKDNPVLAYNMLTSDPPDHTRLRRLVAKAFTPRRTESLRPRVQEITDELVDAMAARGHGDLLDDFAFPLPITVICELLGVPAEDRDAFRAWSAAVVSPALDEEGMRRRAEVNAALRGYFTRVIAERRAVPQDDMISALVAASADEELLSEQELLATLTLLLVAGHETTVNLIGNGMLALLTNPGQLRLLKDRPELLPSAIEEFLRYDGPVQRATLRFATEDLQIAGVPIPRNSVVHVALGAMDRDPEEFDTPDTLDITRADNHHVAFGHGIHFCLGAPLARLEGQIAFETLLRRLPDIDLACTPGELSWRQNGSFIRGLQALPVRF
ncbi:cytochrome P450 [Streptosporangium album]|uniref:Cytochrome P450 n=1 Tax=Streptosporangium album TaxID=47479 RepID=A0A7W7S1V1_9ACTN|nr:cytochrome P450 [Streptosporangium album]MBB4942336.1 cytochrome P450 [Streptosporangium album]